MAEGWYVAVSQGAQGVSKSLPRSTVILNFEPISDCAAVAPRQTITWGFTIASSVSSQGRQALTSPIVGLAWMRFLPRGSHLKCLTALVT